MDVDTRSTKGKRFNGVDFSVLFDRLYVQIIHQYPVTTLILSIVCFLIAPLIVLYFFPISLGISPEKGFDTTGTPYDKQRITWSALQSSLAKGSRVTIDVSSIRTRRSWIDDLIQTFGSVACYDEPIPAMSYMAQFIVAVPNFDSLFSPKLLSQLCHLQQHLDSYLRPFDTLTPYRQIWHIGQFFACLSPHNHPSNCTYLSVSEISSSTRQIVERCAAFRFSIIECRRNCQEHHQIQPLAASHLNCKKEQCSQIPTECSGQMWFDLFYRILPKDLTQRPLQINNFLPIYTYAAYLIQGFGTGSKSDEPIKVKDYVEISAALKRWSKKMGDVLGSGMLELKGVSMDIKRELLLEAAIDDSKFSLVAALCVLSLIAIYSISVTYTLAVLVQICASIICSMALYRAFNEEFPLLNLIVFVLLISIGVDGTFLLLKTFPSAEKYSYSSIRRCLKHTAGTMFLTQFSTVVPFLLNIFSSVIAFRTFGLFAGITLVFNYFLLIIFLPAFLVIQQRYINPWLTRRMPSSLWYCFPTNTASSSPTNHSPVNSKKEATNQTEVPPSNPKKSILTEHLETKIKRTQGPMPMPATKIELLISCVRSSVDDVLPMVLIEGRFLWISSLFLMFIFGMYICISQLSLPRFNPLQLFVASNVHEYYDNNAELLFEFVSDKIALPLSIRLVWGVQLAHQIDYFDTKHISVIEANPKFRLSTLEEVEHLADQIKSYRELSFVQHTAKFWPERFLEWSALQSCNTRQRLPGIPNVVCCNSQSPQYSDVFLDFCIRFSTTRIATNYNDTLIFHNTTHELVGYSALLPTKLRYSHRFSNLSASFDQFEKAFNVEQYSHLPMWYTTEWSLMSTWFDLQRTIISDFKQSVIVSFIVVIVFSLTVLRLKTFYAILTIFAIDVCTIATVVFLGWEIGVLEGVILVLVVGLSFDYTLHYGAMIPKDEDRCAFHKIQYSVRKATLPNGLAAVSSILAGLMMFFAQTQAFIQVAIFLVVCCSFSFIFATFFFLPLTYIVLSFQQLSAKSSCKLCPQ